MSSANFQCTTAELPGAAPDVCHVVGLAPGMLNYEIATHSRSTSGFPLALQGGVDQWAMVSYDWDDETALKLASEFQQNSQQCYGIGAANNGRQPENKNAWYATLHSEYLKILKILTIIR
ncbi:uncharacterized protein N7503_001199 [Penicillium pulvis]|uniref:uncharacterized protein n=1 Tax=Penicillium pulvis TaxID=1562058 RepID=UPI002546D6AF|nr:uncharacterized protein N7503_001199 [Penicillium pulvis]KAJ5814449.1 hypothetical protein N7503_001199 [Penicillium pulvis]